MAIMSVTTRPSNELSARDEFAVPQDVTFPNAANIGPRLMRLNGMRPPSALPRPGRVSPS